MGYYMKIQDSTWRLPPERYEEALRRLKALNHKPGVHKHGGRWDAGQHQRSESWFSWMPADYDQQVNSVRDVLELLGFNCEESEAGLHITGYDSKRGQEDLFLAEINDLASPGSVIRWQGEDGLAWSENYGLPG